MSDSTDRTQPVETTDEDDLTALAQAVGVLR